MSAFLRPWQPFGLPAKCSREVGRRWAAPPAASVPVAGDQCGHLLFNPGTFEKLRVGAGIETGGVRKGELPEIVLRDQLALYQFIRFAEHCRDIRHIPVADVRTENDSKSGAQRVHPGIKSVRVQGIICLAADIDVRYEQVP